MDSDWRIRRTWRLGRPLEVLVIHCHLKKEIELRKTFSGKKIMFLQLSFLTDTGGGELKSSGTLCCLFTAGTCGAGGGVGRPGSFGPPWPSNKKGRTRLNGRPGSPPPPLASLTIDSMDSERGMDDGVDNGGMPARPGGRGCPGR